MEVYNILFNRLLAETAKRNASDLHLSVGSIPVIRKDGKLVKLDQEKIIEQETLKQIVHSFLEDSEKEKLEKERDITVVKVLGGHFRFKINIYYQKNLLAVSFRLIPEAIRDFSLLELPPILENFTKAEGGLLIIAGPYGSGKTTTTGAIIEKINNDSSKRILTLEDPIEIQFVSKNSVVEQREIGKDVPNLVDGLKYCQNEDIDILMVGEIKQDFAESLPLIFDIASSNCFVILEINADSTVRVIEKILEAIPPAKLESARTILADVLEGIIVQKLLPKQGGGLVLAPEILLVNSAIESVIREGKIKQIPTTIQTSGGEGMISMNQSLINLVNSGKVSREDAMAESGNKQDFQIMIK